MSAPGRSWRAIAVLGMLFTATVAAALATQRLKDQPAVLRRVHVTPVFSPNGDGWRDRATVKFLLGRADRVSVTIVDRRGAEVRRLAIDRWQPRGRFVLLRWNGLTDHRRPALPGTYRVRVSLSRRARSVLLRSAITLSGRPPHAKAVPR